MEEKLPFSKRPEPKVVGEASPSKKEEYKQIILDNFGEKHLNRIPENQIKILESLEYEKKPYERLAIKIANDITNSLMKKSGMKMFDVPEKNIHIIPENLYVEILGNTNTDGITILREQLILIDADKNIESLKRALVIFHEIIHLKGYLALEANKEDFEIYRAGLGISTLKQKSKKIGYGEMLRGLNEAVVTEITKRYSSQFISQNKYLLDEYEWQNSYEAKKYKEKIAKELKLEEDEIYWISKDGKTCLTFPYYKQRQVLYYIVQNLYKDNPEKFKSEDDVLELFFKSHFNGKLLEIGRLIQKSFGENALRVIAMMNDEKNSPSLVMDYLIKNRKKIK